MNGKTKKLKLWMRIGQPLEPVMYSHKSIFDAWEAGGVCGLVLGRMHFEGNIPEALTDFFRNVKTHFDEIDRKVKLGLGPRSACFAPLNGYDFAKLADVVDVLLPKHYFWNRGVDGLYGTVARYIDALTDWNPDLTDADALLVVRALFGLSLPKITNRDDIEKEFPPEFFTEVVSLETRRALAVVDTPERIVPWVDAGRQPHGGDLINADALCQMLIAAQDAGLVRFLYHN